MDEEALQTISEQFGSQKREGLGLGLSISRWIIERNGGRMTLWSAPGEGFHVQLVLPIMEDTK